MFSSLPIPKQIVGNTFVIAISLLGLIALGQIGAVGWTLLAKAHAPVADPLAALPAPGAQPSTEPGELKNAETLYLATPTDEQQLAMGVIPKPTPIPQIKEESNSEARITELVEQAKILRDRGDTSTALTHLHEGLAISPSSPMVLSELAITYEKMGMADKALEQWRHIFEMGETAGIYYAAADAKIKNLDIQPRPVETMPAPTPAPAAALAQAPASAPAATPVAAPAASPQADVGIQPGSVLGLVDITAEDAPDPADSKRFNLKIPVKARPDLTIDPHEVAIQVYFYDIADDHSIVRTDANVNYHWNTPPVDWAHGDIEVLEAQYEQPKGNPKMPSSRKYFGYIVRIYYKGELQDMRADPVKLLKEYPPPLNLPADTTE